MGSQPDQAWAHAKGLVSMRTHGAAPAGNALDRLLIQEALCRFGMAHDENRIEVLRSLFTDDARLEVAKGDVPFLRIEGRDRMVTNFANVIAQQQDQRRHCVTNVLIEDLTQDSARALAYGIVSVAADGITLGVSVIYVADFCREADGVWRMSYLLIGMDDYSGTQPKI